MVEFRNISKQYGPQEVLRDVSFRINSGERVGIVGPNGAGKSTLFGLISQEFGPDGGDVLLPKNIRLGCLRQQLNAYAVEESVLEYTSNALPSLNRLHDEIVRQDARLHRGEGERDKILQRIGELQTAFEHQGGYEMRTRAEAALSGLGFKEADFNRPFSSFSGGWQMRSELARTLIGRPDVLMLDEPTNYLDLPAVEWMQRYLRDFPGTLMLISHDRFLLRSLATTMIEVAYGNVVRYAGGYDYYIRERELRHEQLRSAQKNQDRKIEEVERFIERFRSKNTKATQVQSRVKMLEKMERIEAPQVQASLSRIRLPDPPHCGAEIVRLEGVGVAYEPDTWILRGVDLRIQKGEKFALVGFNGMGKTTLLRVLAGVLAPREGKRVLGHEVVPGYQSQEFADTMPPDRTALQLVASMNEQASTGEVRTLLGSFGFEREAVDKPCKVLSGGEKIRLAFARLFINPPNFLLLDEPTTHLDLEGRQALEQALQQYQGTLCLVSHDVTFVRAAAESVIAMTPPGITRYYGNYDYYREKLAEASGDAVQAESHPKKAEARPARGRRRKQASAERIRLKRKIRETEAAIEQYEQEQTDLVAQLSGEAAHTDFASLNRRLKEIQVELSHAIRDWEEYGTTLENLDA